jgi:putative transposase
MIRDYYPHLQPGCYYHVFNQGNARGKVFFREENYIFFLRKMDLYLLDFVDIYSFCLLSNHFHMLIRLKEEEKILLYANRKKDLQAYIRKTSDRKNLAGMIVSEVFRRLFLSYSKALNKQQNRTGSLFRKNFKRIIINNEHYLKQVVLYIHKNPKHHGYRIDFKEYPWSSYRRILDKRITKIKREEVTNWFGGRNTFIAEHEGTWSTNVELEEDGD